MNILIIGAGKMGYSIGSIWADIKNLDIHMVDKSPSRRVFIKEKKKNILVTQDIPDNWKGDIVVLAVKPQTFKSAAKQISSTRMITKNIISIMAGISASKISKLLNTKTPITRIMPNISINVNLGVSCILFPKKISKNNAQLVNKLFKVFGNTYILNSEKLLNSVTAISGSGPAYVFLFLLIFEDISRELGFSKSISKKLVYDVVKGALELSKNESNMRNLILSVTSNKGTTEKALKVLEKNNSGLYELMRNAVLAANDRAIQLSKQV